MLHRLLLILALLALTGCASTPNAGGLDAALSAYDDGDYAAASEAARAAMTRGDEAAKADAAYVAGLAAYRQGHRREAEMRFDAAVAGGSASTAARSRAMLGVMCLEEGRTAEGTQHLEQAARHLDDDDAEQARRLVARAARTGRGQTASPVWTSGTGGRFTLQAGAFRERHRAEAVAREVTVMLARHGGGTVKFLTSEDERGRDLYLVQFGRFESRQHAARVRDQLGRKTYIVVPVRSGA